MSSLIGIGLTPLLDGYMAHSHTYWELAYYFEGEGVIKVGDRDISFSPGTLVCVPPNSVHEELAKNGFRNYHFSLTDFSLGENDIIFHDNASHDILKLLEMLYRAVYANDEASTGTPLAKSLFDALLNTILSNTFTMNKYVERMVNSIILNISNPLYKISDSYKGIPMSCDHLRRLFISQTGMTPTEYLLDKRIGQAERMLYANSHPSIKQIASLCGFSDQYYFSRAFKKHTGVSPLKYSQKI